MRYLLLLILFPAAVDAMVCDAENCIPSFSGGNSKDCMKAGALNFATFEPGSDLGLKAAKIRGGEGVVTISSPLGEIGRTGPGGLFNGTLDLYSGETYYVLVNASSCAFSMSEKTIEDDVGRWTLIDASCQDCAIAVDLFGPEYEISSCSGCIGGCSCPKSDPENAFAPYIGRYAFLAAVAGILLALLIAYHIGKTHGKKHIVEMLVDFKKAGRKWQRE